MQVIENPTETASYNKVNSLAHITEKEIIML